MVKNPSPSAEDIRDMGLIPGSGRSPGEGNGNSLQYSWVGNPISYRPWDHKELDTTEQLTNNHCQVLSI